MITNKIVKKIFIVSLYHKGLIGGKLQINENKIVYSTNKKIIDKKYQKININKKDIIKLEYDKLFILPIVVIKTNQNEIYKFIIFSIKKFKNTITKFNYKESDYNLYNSKTNKTSINKN